MIGAQRRVVYFKLKALEPPPPSASRLELRGNIVNTRQGPV